RTSTWRRRWRRRRRRDGRGRNGRAGRRRRIGQAECIANAVAAVEPVGIAVAIAAGAGPSRRLHQREGGTSAQKRRSPPTNARIAPVVARQTNHCASFAPVGVATQSESSVDGRPEAKSGK